MRVRAYPVAPKRNNGLEASFLQALAVVFALFPRPAPAVLGMSELVQVRDDGKLWIDLPRAVDGLHAASRMEHPDIRVWALGPELLGVAAVTGMVYHEVAYRYLESSREVD